MGSQLPCVNKIRKATSVQNKSKGITDKIKNKRCGNEMMEGKSQNGQAVTLQKKPIVTRKLLLNPLPYSKELYQNKVQISQNDHMVVKVPLNEELTLYGWKEEQYYVYPSSITNLTPTQISSRTFQEKLMWFRLNMEKLRVPWDQGFENISVDRGNILLSVKSMLSEINFHKEVKVKFNDQKVADAGGLLREYIHLAMKEIFSKETGIFQLCDTRQTAYKIIWDQDLYEEFATNIVWVLGVLLGKAIFDRISINCPLNHTILRQLCSQNLFLNDVYSFDQKLYQAWASILECDNPEQLFLTFTDLKIHSNGIKQDLQLVGNGSNIIVSKQNKERYISQLIHLHCTSSIKHYLDTLRAGVEKVIPLFYFEIFEPHEMEMLIGGPQTIDVNDWERNTEYKGYSTSCQVVRWFWEVVGELNQEYLKNLLHYCTGTNRVPVLGFKYLQSNRNKICLFCIQQEKYNPHNPYPKGHTCFNRLELPAYNTKEELRERLVTLLRKEMSHFGLD